MLECFLADPDFHMPQLLTRACHISLMGQGMLIQAIVKTVVANLNEWEQYTNIFPHQKGQKRGLPIGTL